MKGWNWGDAKFEGALLSFMVDSKPAFEIPLEEVSQAIPGKNEITLEFHQNDDTPVSRVVMRFHIPNVEGSEDPVKVTEMKGVAYLAGIPNRVWIVCQLLATCRGSMKCDQYNQQCPVQSM